MRLRRVIFLGLFFLIFACSKEDPIYKPTSQIDPFKVYQEGLNAFEKNDFFYARKKFDEAESNFSNPQFAAKASLMSSFSLYAINFYAEALESLKRYLKNYPADTNIVYAHYLEAIIYFEQIDDEKKDLKPLLEASKKIDFFVKKYPYSDYATDLKFKKNLIQNQLAAKELFIARYYISIQKWVPAIQRLKNIINNYQTTIFVEEALHRLVEVHYYLGLENEAKEFANLLGYNYNSSEWYQKSYKIIKKEYNIKNSVNKKNKNNVNEKSLLKKIIEIIN